MRYYPDAHDPVVRHLFQCKMSDEQIAERLGVSWQTVRRHRQRLGLGMPGGREPKFARPAAETLPPNAPEPTSPVQVAKLTLGGRVTERNGGYVLDRTPVSTADLVREANRMRLNRGLSQFGPEAWRV